MKNYIFTGGSSLVAYDAEVVKPTSKDFETIDHKSLHLDWAWRIHEDGSFFAQGKEYEVHAGDIVLCLFQYTGDERNFVIIHSKELMKHLLAFEEAIAAERERSKEGCCSSCPYCSKSSEF